ncbi:hypothetical protein, partial [Thiolapillus sp.]
MDWTLPSKNRIPVGLIPSPVLAGGAAPVTDGKSQRLPRNTHQRQRDIKRVFGLVKDFGTSQSPKSTRPLTTY